MPTNADLKASGVFLGGFSFVILFCVILYATNPQEDVFKDYLQERIESAAQQEGGFTGAVMDLFAAPAAWVVGLTTERADFYLFSVYSVETPAGTQLYLGALNHFVPIGY